MDIAVEARRIHPDMTHLHNDPSTVGGPHPIPGAVFNIDLLKRHTSERNVKGPLRAGVDKFEYVNNYDAPRALESGVTIEIASACPNPLSTKKGDLTDFNPHKLVELYGRHEAVYDGLEALTDGAYRTIRSREELEPALAKGGIVMVRHIEGLNLPSDPRLGFKMLDRLMERGVRSFGLIWNEPTALASTCYFKRLDLADQGLTDYGRDVVTYLVERGMMIDLSHASPNTMRDTLKLTPDNAKILATHIGSRRLTDHPRNIYPDIAQEVAKRGTGPQKGLVGVPLVRSFVLMDPDSQVSVRDVVGHIRDFREIFGGSVDNIGLGPDLGGTQSGSRIPGLDDIAIVGTTLYGALQESQEFTEVEIAKIFGLNGKMYLNQNLPSGAA
jgi:microsomal dipeptidase-like Zn-dependent dipeptidase